MYSHIGIACEHLILELFGEVPFAPDESKRLVKYLSTVISGNVLSIRSLI